MCAGPPRVTQSIERPGRGDSRSGHGTVSPSHSPSAHIAFTRPRPRRRRGQNTILTRLTTLLLAADINPSVSGALGGGEEGGGETRQSSALGDFARGRGVGGRRNVFLIDCGSFAVHSGFNMSISPSPLPPAVTTRDMSVTEKGFIRHSLLSLLPIPDT